MSDLLWVRYLTDVSPVRLEVLRALVGHIPPNPLWAELIWQRQQEMTKQLPAHMSSPGPLNGAR